MHGAPSNDPRGQAMVVVAVSVLVLTALLALALDGGRIYLDRRQLQNAADAGALAAAERLQVLPYPSYFGAHTQALQAVTKNLPGTSSAGLTAPTGTTWGPVAIGAGYTVRFSATPSTYQATVQHVISTVVAPIHGFAPTLLLQAQATAQNGNLPFAVVLLQNVSGTYANLQLVGSPAGLTLEGGGSAADRGGVYSNASVSLGTGTITFGTSVCTGGVGNNGEIWTVTPTSLPATQVVCPQSVPQARSATLLLSDPGYPEPPPPSFVAAGGITISAGTSYLCPGTYGSTISVGSGATAVLVPGAYRIQDGGVSVGGTLRTLTAGEVIPAGSTVNCALALPYTAPADTGVILEFTPVNPAGKLDCSHNKLSAAAGSTVTLQQSPKFYNISVFVETLPSWTTTCSVAPLGSNVVAIAAGATTSIYGTLYGPADNMQIGGGTAGYGLGQIIAWTLTVNPGTSLTVTFDPTKNPYIKGLTQ